jgi:hypothetical protein
LRATQLPDGLWHAWHGRLAPISAAKGLNTLQAQVLLTVLLAGMGLQLAHVNVGAREGRKAVATCKQAVKQKLRNLARGASDKNNRLGGVHEQAQLQQRQAGRQEGRKASQQATSQPTGTCRATTYSSRTGKTRNGTCNKENCMFLFAAL